jgi:hypothetical protein
MNSYNIYLFEKNIATTQTSIMDLTEFVQISPIVRHIYEEFILKWINLIHELVSYNLKRDSVDQSYEIYKDKLTYLNDIYIKIITLQIKREKKGILVDFNIKDFFNNLDNFIAIAGESLNELEKTKD